MRAAACAALKRRARPRPLILLQLPRRQVLVSKSRLLPRRSSEAWLAQIWRVLVSQLALECRPLQLRLMARLLLPRPMVRPPRRRLMLPPPQRQSLLQPQEPVGPGRQCRLQGLLGRLLRLHSRLQQRHLVALCRRRLRCWRLAKLTATKTQLAAMGLSLHAVKVYVLCWRAKMGPVPPVQVVQ